MLHNASSTTDKDGNITLTGSLFENPHVVAALVGTKSVTCETVAVGEELKFTIKLGVTKSIHDVKPSAATPANTVAVQPLPHEAEIHKNVVTPTAPVPTPSTPAKPGTQAAIPAQPEKAKTA